jgi:hypothetical protein
MVSASFSPFVQKQKVTNKSFKNKDRKQRMRDVKKNRS